MLSQLCSHGFPEQTESMSRDIVLLAPVGTVVELMLSGHWQTSNRKKVYIAVPLNYMIQYFINVLVNIIIYIGNLAK